MNTQIQKAQIARAEKALSTLVRWDGKVTTRKEYIEARLREGWKTETGLCPELRFNRTKFNRMTNQAEQDAYYDKCTRNTKTRYTLTKGSTLVEITKFEYDYANEYSIRNSDELSRLS